MGGKIPALLPIALAAALLRPSITLAFQLPFAGLQNLARRPPQILLQRRSMGLVVNSFKKEVGLKPVGRGITTTVPMATDSAGEVGSKPAGKPITFRHRLCVAPMIGVCPSTLNPQTQTLNPEPSIVHPHS